MKCPHCNRDMAPTLEVNFDTICFLCSCGQIEHVVSEALLNEWVLQAYALRFVGKGLISIYEKGAEAKVKESVRAVAAGLSGLQAMH